MIFLFLKKMKFSTRSQLLMNPSTQAVSGFRMET